MASLKLTGVAALALGALLLSGCSVPAKSIPLSPSESSTPTPSATPYSSETTSPSPEVTPLPTETTAPESSPTPKPTVQVEPSGWDWTEAQVLERCLELHEESKTGSKVTGEPKIYKGKSAHKWHIFIPGENEYGALVINCSINELEPENSGLGEGLAYLFTDEYIRDIVDEVGGY